MCLICMMVRTEATHGWVRRRLKVTKGSDMPFIPTVKEPRTEKKQAHGILSSHPSISTYLAGLRRKRCSVLSVLNISFKRFSQIIKSEDIFRHRYRRIVRRWNRGWSTGGFVGYIQACWTKALLTHTHAQTFRHILKAIYFHQWLSDPLCRMRLGRVRPQLH